MKTIPECLKKLKKIKRSSIKIKKQNKIVTELLLLLFGFVFLLLQTKNSHEMSRTLEYVILLDSYIHTHVHAHIHTLISSEAICHLEEGLQVARWQHFPAWTALP